MWKKIDHGCILVDTYWDPWETGSGLLDSVGDKAVYEDTTTMVKVDGQHSKALSVIEISSGSSVIHQENPETASL